jgi:predicted Zn-dependent protease
LTLAAAAPAQQRITPPPLLRDAEIESIIRSYATPIFEAAGLNAEDVRVVLVNDNKLNAFVAGGMNLFLHVGLLMRAESPGQLIAVMAHESGHIAGGHLARGKDRRDSLPVEEIVAMIVGAGVAVATGEAGAGVATLGAAQSIAQADLMKYSRTQEHAADQAALAYLERTGQSARPMLALFRLMQQQEALLATQQDPYMRSHPLTRERMAAVEAHIARSPYSDTPERPEFLDSFARMRAKLIGYLQPLQQVLIAYPVSDTSLPARYARALGYWRGGRHAESVAEMQSLLAEEPDNPYFNEQLGQILFQTGRLAEALPFYERSVALAPTQPLLRMELARLLNEIGGAANYRTAIAHLEEVVRYEPRNAGAWRQLSIAYGRDGQLAMAALALAEAAEARGDDAEARQQADRAMRQLPEGSPAYLRAQDILSAARTKS